MEKIKDIKIVMDILKSLFELKNSLIGDLDKQVHEQNINRSEFITLISISGNEKKSMSDLCRDVDLKSGSLTTLIDNLIEKGYVKREFDKRDRRKILVQLTTKGKDFVKIIKKSFEDNTFNKVEKLTVKDTENLFKAVDTIKEITIKLKGKE